MGNISFEINFTGKQRPLENLHRVNLTIDRKRFLMLKKPRTREQEHRNIGTQEHRNTGTQDRRNMLEDGKTCQKTRTRWTNAGCKKKKN